MSKLLFIYLLLCIENINVEMSKIRFFKTKTGTKTKLASVLTDAVQ